ncbi:hypothetical protein VTN00DRAFT_6813 [Thermoascus crustaceus]|uniref:uncharacterized protein n=1 Tax=Thermoascus crustaceus TaxID=5088 RepID=UPI00374399ED
MDQPTHGLEKMENEEMDTSGAECGLRPRPDDVCSGRQSSGLSTWLTAAPDRPGAFNSLWGAQRKSYYLAQCIYHAPCTEHHVPPYRQLQGMKLFLRGSSGFFGVGRKDPPWTQTRVVIPGQCDRRNGYLRCRPRAHLEPSQHGREMSEAKKPQGENMDDWETSSFIGLANRPVEL